MISRLMPEQRKLLTVRNEVDGFDDAGPDAVAWMRKRESSLRVMDSGFPASAASGVSSFPGGRNTLG